MIGRGKKMNFALKLTNQEVLKISRALMRNVNCGGPITYLVNQNS